MKPPPHVSGRLFPGPGTASSRTTYRYLWLAREVLERLGGDGARGRSLHAPTPSLELLDLCLLICRKRLGERQARPSRSKLEERIAAVLDSVVAEREDDGSRRVGYALAAMHFVERTLGSSPAFRLGRGGAVRRNVARLNEERRSVKNCNTYSTPDFIAEAMVADLFRALEREGRASADVLDLSAEAGHFPLTSAALWRGRRPLRFFALDRDAEAVRMVKRVMAFVQEGRARSNFRLETATRDSLLQRLPAGWPRSFTAVIGNPPWRRRILAGPGTIRERYHQFLRGHSELYLPFILRADELLATGGFLSFVLPSGFLFNWNATPVRKLLLERYDLLSLSIYPQRSFVEIPCLIPVSFLARKHDGASPQYTTTRISYHQTPLGGPNRPRGTRMVSAAKIWRSLPASVIHPLARADCSFLVRGLDSGSVLGDFGRLHLGLRLRFGRARSPRRSFRGIRAADIRPFHVCPRGTRLYRTADNDFDHAPDESLVTAEKVVFQELRYMTHRQRLVAAVAASRTYPVSTASMFVPDAAGSADFFAALLNSALANAWYKLRDVTRSIKLAHLRSFPVVHDEKAWKRIAALARSAAALRRRLHARLPNCTVRSEDELLSRRFPAVHGRLRTCRQEIDRLVFDLYELPEIQRQAAARLADARTF